jgi:Hpt domain
VSNPTPAVLCTATGLSNCLDSRAFYAQVMQKYLQCHAGDAAALEAAIQSGDVERAIHIVHTLVASSATVGALALEQQARGVLAGLRACGAVSSPPAWPSLKDAHGQTLQAMQAWLEAPVQLTC